MKVIFLKDVLPTARVGEVKVVKNGFGRNYLLPNGLAMAATPAQLRRSEGLRKSAQDRKDKEAAEWRNMVAGIRGTAVTITAKAGPNGRLFGSVTTQMIAAHLSNATGKVIDRRGIRVPTQIRQLGTYSVGVHLFEGVETEVRVVVKAEASLEPAEPKAAKAAAEAEAVAEPAQA